MTRCNKGIALLFGSVWLFSAALPAHSSLIFNEIHADPAPNLTGDANGDGTRDGSQDEFIELVNTSSASVDIGGWTILDAVTTRHTFNIGTIIDSEMAIVIFGGGTPTGSFGGAQVVTASSGFLGLNNSGDTITLKDVGLNVIDMTSYGSEGANNQSLTLDPDLTGSFVQHIGAAGSNGALFSPGTRIDGTSFGPSRVPEPATVALMGLGLAGIGYRRRQLKKA